MARFEDLPLDLLPEILVHLLIPDHLTSLCLVSRTIYSFSVPKLYRRIVILPSHKSSKSRVCILIFSIFSEVNSLTSCHAGNKFIQNSRGVSQPRLPCAPIRFASHALQYIFPYMNTVQLEIRDFPKCYYGVASPDEQSINTFAKGLENCVHLKACTWSRDGSLTSEILACLARCPELTDITLNGGHSHYYEPMDLVQLLRLRKISLIMPSISVIRILPHWLRAIGQSLTSLSLICKARIFRLRAFACHLSIG